MRMTVYRFLAAGLLSTMVLVSSAPVGLAAEADDAAILRAWEQYKKGDINGALAAAEAQYVSGARNSVVLTTLLGHIYRKKSDSSRALTFFGEARPVLADVVWRRTSEPAPEDVHEAFTKMYLGLLRDSTVAHANLGMCGQSMIDAREIALVQGADKATATGVGLSQMGFCKYQMQEYDLASKAFAQAHQEFPAGLFKDEAAFNAAATRARLRDVQGAIGWVRIAIERDGNPWIAKIATDDDFKDVRGERDFQEFLSSIGR